MPPVSKQIQPKTSNADKNFGVQIRKTSALSKIIIQGTEQLLDIQKNPNIQFIEKPRRIQYSNSSIGSAGVDNDNVASSSNADKTFGPSKKKRTSTDVISEISGMSVGSVSVRNHPFANFLQDFCLAHGSIPRESVQEAIAKWDAMPAREKKEFTPENYVLKLCNQVRNRDEILNAVALNPASRTTRKVQIVKKSIKRLAPRPRGVVSPRKSLKNAVKKKVPPKVPVRLTKSGGPYKNFLRKIRQTIPGLWSVERSSLWRKMTPAEKDLYRVVDQPNQDRTKVRKVSRVEASKRVRIAKASRSTQTPKNALSYWTGSCNILSDNQLQVWRERNTSTENAVNSESSLSIQSNSQLQAWTQSNASPTYTSRSWLRFEYITKAFEKFKNMFN